jgi:biopolymer transport protein ExbB/TolQ
LDTAVIAASANSALVQSVAGGFELGDFWSLTQQAGPLRWAIYVVLGIGLVQVFIKLYELLRDWRASKQLSAVDLTSATLDQIAANVARQEETMLSSLQSTMINVFRTRSSEGMLHDEISNFVSFQQDQFGVFRRRMDFLSDTAGALGLMGTVWGMFTVFFQGTAEQDVILRGMGIALITTLLGLVVSIILNFSATELSTFFERRLEQVSRKSDELRFRLLELASERSRAGTEPAVTAEARPEPAGAATPPRGETPPPSPRETEAQEHSVGVPTPTWRYVEMEGGERVAQAGEVLRKLGLLVKNADGQPSSDVPVLVTIPGTEGALDGGARQLRTTSDDAGRIEFACTVPQSVGPFALDVSLPEQLGPSTRLEVMIRPGTPHRVDQEGNNQAAVAGMRLPLPLGVRVLDRFGNPVPGVPVGFAVKQGGGKLGSGKSDHRVSTNALGLASTPFVVSSEAGHNVVAATIDGTKKSVEFVTFGTEV